MLAVMRHDDDRAARVMDNLAARRAHHQAGESAAAARADHQQVSVEGSLNEFTGCVAADRNHGHRGRTWLLEAASRFGYCFLGGRLPALNLRTSTDGVLSQSLEGAAGCLRVCAHKSDLAGRSCQGSWQQPQGKLVTLASPLYLPIPAIAVTSQPSGTARRRGAAGERCADQILWFQPILRSWPAHSLLRSSVFWILPVAVLASLVISTSVGRM